MRSLLAIILYCHFVSIHLYHAVDSFILDMGNYLHSSSDNTDNDEYEYLQDNYVLLVMNTYVFV